MVRRHKVFYKLYPHAWSRVPLVAASPESRANLQAFIFGATLAAVFQMFVATPALALTNIATVVCGWAPTVGTIGTALAFIVFLAGIAMVAVGSKQGFGRVIWAIIGAVALFTGTQLFTTLTGGACGDTAG